MLTPVEPVLVTGWGLSYFIHVAVGDRAHEEGGGELGLGCPHPAPCYCHPTVLLSVTALELDTPSLGQDGSGVPISPTTEGTLAWVA